MNNTLEVGQQCGIMGIYDDSLLIYNEMNADIALYTNATERMRIDSAGRIGIGTSAPGSMIHVLGGALGGTAGNELIVSQIRATNSNQDIVYTKYRRVTTGADWTTAQAKIQRTIDVTNMGYIAFGGTATYDVRLGTGTSDLATFATTGTTITTFLTTSKVLVVKGTASQAANLQEWQNSAGTVLAYVAADGTSSFGNAADSDQAILATSIFS